MKVKEIMNKAIVIDDSIKVREAAKIMSERRIGSLIVLVDEKIVGIITERDIMKNVGRLDGKVSNIMSKNVVTVEEKESIDDAAALMARHKIKRLPILKKGKLTGIVTATDLIANSNELNEEFFFD